MGKTFFDSPYNSILDLLFRYSKDDIKKELNLSLQEMDRLSDNDIAKYMMLLDEWKLMERDAMEANK